MKRPIPDAAVRADRPDTGRRCLRGLLAGLAMMLGVGSASAAEPMIRTLRTRGRRASNIGSVARMLHLYFAKPIATMASRSRWRLLTEIFRPFNRAGPPAIAVHSSSQNGS